MTSARVLFRVARFEPSRACGLFCLVASLACRNVATGGAGDEGNAIETGGTVPSPSSTLAASTGALPSTEPVVPAVAATILAAPSGDVVEPEPPSQLILRATDAVPARCEAWLDALDEVDEADLRVSYHPEAEPAIEMPFVEHTHCSRVWYPVSSVADAGRTRAADAGFADAGFADAGFADAGFADAAATAHHLGDAGGPDDGGAPGSEQPVYTIVDLSIEGWYLAVEDDGTYLRLCPNACFTFRERGGAITIDLGYRIAKPGAR